MDRITISLFGKLKIQHPTRGPVEIEQRRSQELLCYLLLYRDRLHEREKIAALLWGESSPTQSKRNLRQTLWALQSNLQSFCHENNLLSVENGWLGINQQANFLLDIAELEAAYTRLDSIGDAALTLEDVALLKQAAQRYHGELFEGCYEDWCVYERERYQIIYLTILDHLLAYCENQHDYESGLDYALQILRYDHAREQTHRQLMRIYARLGNRSAAIHQYEACVAALREELDVTPAVSTVELYHLIRSEQLVRAPSPTANKASCGPFQTTENETILRLERIQASLAYLQDQVSQLLVELR